MGFWFNNFQEFERKKNRENRLILNFYYVPSAGEKPRKVKIFAKNNLKIPTKFIPSGNLDKIKQTIKKSEQLKDFPLNIIRVGNFNILEIELPYINELIQKLPYVFQKGNYDKMLRLGGFFPERKVEFSGDLEEKLKNNEEIELDSLAGINFNGFLTEDEIRKLPWLYIDIEKPLWKSDKEKIYLKARKKLLKLDKKLGNTDCKHELREKAIKNLENRLTIEVEGAGKIGLWEEECDAAVSFITTIWKNCPETIKEIYMLDPKDEFEFETFNNYKLYGFKKEKELISFFLDRVKERKPVLSSGHNEVYDITQIRFASDEHDLDFNPAVKDIRPRRDFVRDFFQRMKEDLVYFDSLWLNATFFPWLKQRTFSNLKLESVSKHHGIDFKKSLTHEQLREVELQRLAGKTSEIRKNAAKKIADYSAGDVDPVVQMIESSSFLPLIIKLKNVLPFCTLTELAFHPNCVNKYHDKKHFDRVKNQRYFGYAQKERENEIQIFKKRFVGLKKKMLDWAGIKASKISGENVYEIYLPLEEWIAPAIFKYTPEFHKLYYNLEKQEKIPFLQYLKALERDMLIDYYFARREAKIFREKYDGFEENFNSIEEVVDRDLLNKYASSFKYLKNHFRSVYVALNGEGRALIRPTKKNISEIGEIPEIMEDEADLFLLRDRAEQIEKMISSGQKKILQTFLANFETFELVEAEITEKLWGLSKMPKEFLYAYNQYKRKKERDTKFYAKYKLPVSDLTSLIAQSYKNLAQELEKHDTKISEIKGDYLFVQAGESIKSSNLVYVVRELESYEFKTKG